MKIKLKEYMPFILILVLGAVLRLAYLGTVPHGMHQDESMAAWDAYALYHEGIDSGGHPFPVYFWNWGDGHSPLYVWLIVPFVALNGGHVNSFISRLPQAIVAILTLIAVYDLMKRLFNKKLGLIAMSLLAICPWHVMMARWGLEVDIAPGFLIFGLYFFVRGLDNKRFLPLSALCYGLVLYCYAVMWPVVPAILLIQGVYCFYHKRLTINRYTVVSVIILFLLALPYILFILINYDIIPEIELPFISISKMPYFRGGQIGHSFSALWSNLKTTLRLLIFQDTGAPQDILLPWGLFYDIGRVFIVIGVVCVLVNTVKAFVKKEFSNVFFLFSSLCGGLVNALIVQASLHQVDALFIPLVLAEGYGIYEVLNFIKKKNVVVCRVFAGVVTAIYIVCLVLFQKDYYTTYQETADAYLAAGVEECLEDALAACKEKGIANITVEQAAQWTRLLLFTEILPSDYLSTVEYDEDMYPAPWSFVYDGIRIQTRIVYDEISTDSIYIIYFTDEEKFKDDFDLTRYYDWYVCIPKENS